MSGNLRKVRDKIKSVKNTQKITKAMQLVAASKMKKFQDKAVYSRGYSLDLLSIAAKIMWSLPTHKYFEIRDKGPTLFILHTSDRGLCGQLNSQLIKTLFQSKEWLNVSPVDRRLIVIGKRGFNYCRFNKIEVHAHFESISENFDAFEALRIVDEVLNFWNVIGCRDVYMIVPHYKSALANYPVVKKYLPFSHDMLKSHFLLSDFHKNKLEEATEYLKSEYLIFEPSQGRIFKRVIEQLLHVMFITAFYELKASEYSSRMVAMQGATDNAQKVSDVLILDLNKARQARITQEISELVSGTDFIS